MMSRELVREVSAEELADLMKGSRPVFVDFSATWCSPCKAMEPIVERLAEHFAGQVEFVKVDIDQYGNLAAQNGVRGVPTFILFRGDEPVVRVVGTNSLQSLISLIEPQLGANQPATV